jgi:hypothetical protein
MKVITTREMRNDAKTFFDLAEKESVAVKRGRNKYVNLVVTDSPDKKFITDDWVNGFFKIPAEYRVNPFDVSPSGDLFWADKRNVEHVDKAIQEAKDGKVISMRPGQSTKDFLAELCTE